MASNDLPLKIAGVQKLVVDAVMPRHSLVDHAGAFDSYDISIHICLHICSCPMHIRCQGFYILSMVPYHGSKFYCGEVQLVAIEPRTVSGLFEDQGEAAVNGHCAESTRGFTGDRNNYSGLYIVLRE